MSWVQFSADRPSGVISLLVRQRLRPKADSGTAASQLWPDLLEAPRYVPASMFFALPCRSLPAMQPNGAAPNVLLR